MGEGKLTNVVSDFLQVDEILNLDATRLAELIKQGEITSLHATETYIAHLKKINKKLNCLVEERFSQAIEEAKQADKQLQTNGKIGRLHGVPISMKESFDVTGMATTGGLNHLANNVKETDAPIVANLKKEGAIILGKTNTPTLSFCQETDNKLYGRTNNPWDLTRTSGGSSGGEGALIAAGGAAVGIASDIGGSIRFPAHFNGVVGFKSGNMQVSDDGALPAIEIPLQRRMLGIGALSKSVQDARLINEIIAHNIPKTNQLDNFKIVIETRKLPYPLNHETHSLLLQLKNSFSNKFEVENHSLPLFSETALIWQLIMAIDGAKPFAEVGFGSEPVKPYAEYIKEVFFKSSSLHRYFTWAIIGAQLFKPNETKLHSLQKTIDHGDQSITKFLENRLVILPVYHSSAPHHGDLYSEIFSIRKTYLKYMPFAAYANVWGLPSLTVPVGEDDNGLPIGIQIISKVGNEDAIFKLGELIEQNFRGYIRKELN